MHFQCTDIAVSVIARVLYVYLKHSNIEIFYHLYPTPCLANGQCKIVASYSLFVLLKSREQDGSRFILTIY